LSLGRDRVGDPVEPLREDQGNRATLRGVSTVGSGVVLGDSLLKTRAAVPV